MADRTVIATVTDVRHEIGAFFTGAREGTKPPFYSVHGQLASGLEPTTEWLGSIASNAVSAEWAVVPDRDDPDGRQARIAYEGHITRTVIRGLERTREGDGFRYRGSIQRTKRASPLTFEAYRIPSL